MNIDFIPTPAQAGSIIARAIYGGPARQLASAKTEYLADAQITASQYENEILLLSYAAAVYAVEMAPLPRGMDTDIVAAIYNRIRELPISTSSFLLQNIEDAVEAYSEAYSEDAEKNHADKGFSVIEEEFGERLFALGIENDTRGQACVRLSFATPKILWDIQFNLALEVLRDARLLQTQ